MQTLKQEAHGSHGVKLAHLQPNILTLHPLPLRIPPTSNHLPDGSAHQQKRHNHKWNHDYPPGYFDITLRRVILPYHLRPLHTLQFARPGLEVEGANVIANTAFKGVRGGGKCSGVGGFAHNVAFAEVGSHSVGYVDGDETEEDKNGLCKVNKHGVTAEVVGLSL